MSTLQNLDFRFIINTRLDASTLFIQNLIYSNYFRYKNHSCLEFFTQITKILELHRLLNLFDINFSMKIDGSQITKQ